MARCPLLQGWQRWVTTGPQSGLQGLQGLLHKGRTALSVSAAMHSRLQLVTAAGLRWKGQAVLLRLQCMGRALPDMLGRMLPAKKTAAMLRRAGCFMT